MPVWRVRGSGTRETRQHWRHWILDLDLSAGQWDVSQEARRPTDAAGTLRTGHSTWVPAVLTSPVAPGQTRRLQPGGPHTGAVSCHPPGGPHTRAAVVTPQARELPEAWGRQSSGKAGGTRPRWARGEAGAA